MKKILKHISVAPLLTGIVAAVKILVLTMMMLVACACSPQEAPIPSLAPQEASPDPAKQWIGKDVTEMEKDLGAPTNEIDLEEDRDGGGKMIFYAKPGQPHMVFETAPGSQTISKAITEE